MKYRLMKQGGNRYVLIDPDGIMVDITDAISAKKEPENKYSEETDTKSEYVTRKELENVLEYLTMEHEKKEDFVRDLMDLLESYL
ncbi:hypothetical protein [Mesotoga prima]|uniref:hypothetical protein n=1 Tax=Mesotoga prima TaxID=1184387 RepID=UPI002FDB76C1